MSVWCRSDQEFVLHHSKAKNEIGFLHSNDSIAETKETAGKESLLKSSFAYKNCQK